MALSSFRGKLSLAVRTLFFLTLTMAAACAPQSSTKTVETEQSQNAGSTSASASTDPALPEYLTRLSKSGDLYARDGDSIVNAPAADIAVLRGYPVFPDKGPLTGTAGERLTILTAKTTYLASEEIRVIHVHEATKPGAELYVMGPKAIYGEYIDDVLVSPAAAAPPAPYDGVVLPSPNADHNYEVSVHHLAPGRHRLQWRFATLSGPTVLSSNVLVIEVK